MTKTREENAADLALEEAQRRWSEKHGINRLDDAEEWPEERREYYRAPFSPTKTPTEEGPQAEGLNDIDRELGDVLGGTFNPEQRNF